MQKSVLVLGAAVLAACGAAVTSSNNAAQSATQRSRGTAPPRGVGVPNFHQSGGMAGCFDPNLSGYPRAAAERAGGVPCAQQRSTGATGEGAGGASWTGEYEGQLAGGLGHVRISEPTSANYYRVQAEVGNNACVAEYSAQPTGNRMVMEIPVENNQALCTITLTRNGRAISLRENHCLQYARARRACGFVGTVTLGGQPAAAATMPTRTMSISGTAWIVGAWVPRGEQCGGEGWVVGEDGSYVDLEGAGRWSLAGDTLMLTELQRQAPGGELGEYAPVRNPRPTRAQIVAHAPNAFSMRHPNGAVTQWRRCR
jgi:hypothetical protein